MTKAGRITRAILVGALPVLPGATGVCAQSIAPSVVLARGLPVRADTVDGFVGGKDAKGWFGFYVYAVSRATVGGKPAYLVTTNYTSKEKGGFQSDTLALDAATLDPLWRRFHARTDSASVTFAGRHASGWSLQNDRRVTVDFQLAETTFAAPMLRWLVHALPLAAGYRGDLTVFSIWKNTEDKSAFTVSGAERVEIDGAKFDAWVIQSPTGTKTWVDKTSHRVLQVFAPDGRNGFWLVQRK